MPQQAVLTKVAHLGKSYTFTQSLTVAPVQECAVYALCQCTGSMPNNDMNVSQHVHIFILLLTHGKGYGVLKIPGLLPSDF